jgi:hypothetical protein
MANLANAMNLATIITVLGVLIGLVNILTQVIKKATWDKIPTNLLVVIISIPLTITAMIAYCQINSISILWYFYVAAVIVGFMVAYGSMFGFDKLKEIIVKWGGNDDGE